ncbi:MAG: hypothetical protein IKM97_01605 [Clostridia bacterium]|nr:hypothetical protein [Clostridia bacterium]
MKSKVIKILFLLSLILIVFIGVSYAVDNSTNENTLSPEQALSQSATVTSVTSLSNLPEANLGLNNILNILLLAVGFLLILFSIAILIRLKK